MKHSRCWRRVDPPLLVLSQSLFSSLPPPAPTTLPSPILYGYKKNNDKTRHNWKKKSSLHFFRPQEKLYKSPLRHHPVFCVRLLFPAEKKERSKTVRIPARLTDCSIIGVACSLFYVDETQETQEDRLCISILWCRPHAAGPRRLLWVETSAPSTFCCSPVVTLASLTAASPSKLHSNW